MVHVADRALLVLDVGPIFLLIFQNLHRAVRHVLLSCVIFAARRSSVWCFLMYHKVVPMHGLHFQYSIL